jgi:DNA invertase Pin-like site-specific DNA recombinase
MNAVIYCRVSSREQVEGTSLESQETACREYARKHNLTVQKVFIGQGESAKFADRPELLELLNYCKDKKRGIKVLVVWKLDRFARNVEDHFAVKALLRKSGVEVASVTEPINGDPTGRLMETILAGFAQFDNDVRAARTRLGQVHRLREGIWPFKPPLGYVAPKAGKKFRPDQPDPKTFEPIQRVWQLFLTGSYKKADVVRFLNQWNVRGYHGTRITAQAVDRMFSQPYYAGILRDPWTGEEYQGRHTPMVTSQEFARVQEILAGRSNRHTYQKLNPDFPLRGHVLCPSCRMPLRGAFATGKTGKRYAYYACHSTNCVASRKSYRAEVVHRELIQFLADQSIAPALTDVMFDAVRKAHDKSRATSRKAVAKSRERLERLDRQLQELILMRSSALVSDDEFRTTQRTLRQEITAIRADMIEEVPPPLTSVEEDALRECLRDLVGFWESLAVHEQHAFAVLMTGAGYVLGELRNHGKPLLFTKKEPSRTPLTRLAALTLNRSNSLVRRFRAILVIVQRSKTTVKDAA